MAHTSLDSYKIYINKTMVESTSAEVRWVQLYTVASGNRYLLLISGCIETYRFNADLDGYKTDDSWVYKM